MRPTINSDLGEFRPRKPSLPDQHSTTSDRHIAAPSTFFLTRGSDLNDGNRSRSNSSTNQNPIVSTLDQAIAIGDFCARKAGPKQDETTRSSSRRRSTIKPSAQERTRRESSSIKSDLSLAPKEECLTPSSMLSRGPSLPSTPKSFSSRSPPKSEDELNNEETNSQAISSSGEEEEEMAATVQNSIPELIFPSIKMPGRRPFTCRGKRLQRFKIMVAGARGVGKTSLIKSIVQLCEDIVHVDPISQTAQSPPATARGASNIQEIYASTKPYPQWRSNFDESRILRRRKSMGDSVLERNICFVDTGDSAKLDRLVHYLEQQLIKALSVVTVPNHELTSMMSGYGGSQVDVVFYLISQDLAKENCDHIRRLSELCNVVPLIAKADLLSPEEKRELKEMCKLSEIVIPQLTVPHGDEGQEVKVVSAPYTASSVSGSDSETMEDSLLMSSEYVQPLYVSELATLIQQIFQEDMMSYLRFTAAEKLIKWHAKHPKVALTPSPSITSVKSSVLESPVMASLSASGVLIPMGSELSLTTSNSYTLARVADHTQREERLAQMRLSKWASELQLSLQRERERYEQVARSERALWLVEKMGQEIRNGQVLPVGNSRALVKTDDKEAFFRVEAQHYDINDPLGLLRWQETMKARGWLALQIVGSFGVIGGIAIWVAKSCGFSSSIDDWPQRWSVAWSGLQE